jgi:chitinase
VNASDPDILELGDALTYSDNSPLFDINGRTGKISFKPGPRDSGTFKIKITVKDRDSLTASTEFLLTVIKTNHPPVISSILPKDGTKVSQDRRIALSAQASDPDGDTVNYTWRDGDNLLGYGSEISVVFRDRGTYIITLTVSDGKAQQTNETTLEVVAPSQGGGNGLPGFGAAMAAAAVAAATLALAGKRKR